MDFPNDAEPGPLYWSPNAPTVHIDRSAMPPGEDPISDKLADNEPRIKGLQVGAQVTVIGFVFTVIDKEKLLSTQPYNLGSFHRAVCKQEAQSLRCLFLGWTKLQCGWRLPPRYDGDPEYGDSYEAPMFQADKHITVAVVMPLDSDKARFRKPFRCLPSQIEI